MKDLPSIRWEDATLGLVINATVKIEDSQVEVVCDSTLENFTEVYMRTFDMTRAAVDSFCFVHGFGLSVILDRYFTPDEALHNIMVQEPELATLVTAFDGKLWNGTKQFGKMYRIILSDPAIFRALNDLIVSISVSHHAPINCGRVIETIRVLMTPSGGDRKQGWATMRQKLNLYLHYLSFITEESKGPRHGDRFGITEIAYKEVIKRSWIVMNRFLEYKKRGDKQLPLGKFGLLKN